MFDINPILPGFTTQWSLVATSATPQVLIPPDPQRPILYVMNLTSSNMLMTMDPIPPSGSSGQFLIGNNQSLRFTWTLDGPLSTLGWYVWTPAGAGSLAFTEVRWLPSRLGGG